MLDVIIDNIDVWTSAQTPKISGGRGRSKKGTQTAYGIKKSRALILELAVLGKLVPQNPNDESASELLKKIADERNDFIKKGRIKKQKPITPLSEIEKEIVLPRGWAVEKFGNLAIIERGGSPRPINSYLTNDPNGLNWIKIGDTDIGGKYIHSTAEKIIEEGLSKTRMVYPGDFLLTNSMSFGRPYITKIKGCIHDGWLRISPATLVDKDYLYWLLSSPYVVNAFKDSVSGAVVQNLNSDKVREVAILIPPINEQHRIVSKVDELMALCDQLEQEQTDNNAAHQTLVETLLGTLTESVDNKELQENWSRIENHFDTLFTTEHSIDQLKQTILQLAVMGKLVPQDPNDEPARVLLEKITNEKKLLIKEKQIKKQKPLTPITEDEKLFELPSGWEFSRIGDASLFSEYGVSAKTYDDIGGIPVLKMGDIQQGRVLLGRQKEASTDFDGISELMLKHGDVLYNRTNSAELVGKTGRFDGADDKYSFASYLIRIRCSENNVTSKYLNTFMNSSLFRKTQIEPHLKQQCGQANVNGTVMKGMIVGIPPLAEQNRIVVKVDELMALCDNLKVKINEVQTTQTHLTDAIVEEAVR